VNPAIVSRGLVIDLNQTLDKLDAATAGDTSSASFLTSFLRSLPAGLKRPPRKRPLPPAPEVVEKHELACLPPEKAVLNVRPYANINGPRHIPVLASANGIPFLRFGKPQPPALSRILRQKLDKRITRFDTRVVMEHYWIPIAHQEDEWDDLLRQNYGVTDEGNGNVDEGREVRWADAWYEAKHENVKAYEDDLYSDRRIAKQMQNLVDQETALALEEGQETGRLRNRRKPVKHRWAETRPS
jgi:hypothetical protein